MSEQERRAAFWRQTLTSWQHALRTLEDAMCGMMPPWCEAAVYLIDAGDVGHKVGCSNSPWGRRHAFARKLPGHSLALLHEYRSVAAWTLEGLLHRHYQPWHIANHTLGRKWFRLPPDQAGRFMETAAELEREAIDIDAKEAAEWVAIAARFASPTP
jgi:hypothetical protein